MLAYIMLIMISAMFCFVAVHNNDKKSLKLNIGKGKFIKEHNLAVPVFFVILLFLLALRHESIGRDLAHYKYYFERYSAQELKSLITFEPEFLYGVLNWLVGAITEKYQWLLVSVAVLTVVPIAYVYCQDRAHSMLKIAMFVNMSTFIMLFSGLRQAIAMAVGMFAYQAVKKKKPLFFVLMVILALCFHRSSFILFAMYPVYHLRLKKKHLIVIIPALITVFVFNRQIFGFLLSIYSSFAGGDETITQTGAFGSLVLFAMLAAFAYIIPDESKIDAETLGLRNLLLLAVVLQCFAPLHSLAMRMNYYYILFVPLAVTKVLKIPSVRYKQVALFAEAVMVAFFVFQFVSGVYTSYVTGISALDTVPYIPFWRG